MTEDQKDKVVENDEPIEWCDFLAEHPPGSSIFVKNAVEKVENQRYTLYNLIAPDLHLHCPEQTCNARMFFESEEVEDSIGTKAWDYRYLTYTCRNCGKYFKTYSIAIVAIGKLICKAYKFGELPPFGPPVPSRVLRLIQPDREVFLSGRRSENQSLGIGAFAYYRRVVENQWKRLIDEHAYPVDSGLHSSGIK